MAAKKLKKLVLPKKGIIPAAPKRRKIKGPKVKVTKGWKV